MHKVLSILARYKKNTVCSARRPLSLSVEDGKSHLDQDAMAALVAKETGQAPGLCQLRPVSDAFPTLCSQLNSLKLSFSFLCLSRGADQGHSANSLNPHQFRPCCTFGMTQTLNQSASPPKLEEVRQSNEGLGQAAPLLCYLSNFARGAGTHDCVSNDHFVECFSPGERNFDSPEPSTSCHPLKLSLIGIEGI